MRLFGSDDAFETILLTQINILFIYIQTMTAFFLYDSLRIPEMRMRAETHMIMYAAENETLPLLDKFATLLSRLVERGSCSADFAGTVVTTALSRRNLSFLKLLFELDIGRTQTILQGSMDVAI